MSEGRKEKSLFTLTKKFVEMLNENQTVDLNNVAKELQCTKKRRIYDVSNVLEGIGLIKKTQKNQYKYVGETRKDKEFRRSDKRLQQVKREEAALEIEEKELDKDIETLKQNLNALKANQSYCYLTRQDFVQTQDEDQTILVFKDFGRMKFIFEKQDENYEEDEDEDEDNGYEDNVAQVKGLPLVKFNGYVVRPIQAKMVNTEKIDDSEYPIIDYEDLEEIYNHSETTASPSKDNAVFNHKRGLKKSDELILFKRTIKPKKLIDLDEKELEQLSENVLKHNKYKEKSKFSMINDKQLVSSNDCVDPDFIPIDSPADVAYENNFSAESPSVHDLFDHEAEPLDVIYYQDELSMVEEVVYDEDEIMGDEEYIIEEYENEESYDLMQ